MYLFISDNIYLSLHSGASLPPALFKSAQTKFYLSEQLMTERKRIVIGVMYYIMCHLYACALHAENKKGQRGVLVLVRERNAPSGQFDCVLHSKWGGYDAC
jgi:hypothetical protein